MVILPTNIPPAWESQDAAALKEFLESQSGQRMTAHVASQIPSLLDGSDVNKTLVASGVVKGWGDCLSELFSLLTIQPAQPEAPGNYPSLDDEAHWSGLEGSQKPPTK